jgi:hypothetical protein
VRRRLQKEGGIGGPATDRIPAMSKDVMLRDALRSTSSRRHSRNRSSAAERTEDRPAACHALLTKPDPQAGNADCEKLPWRFHERFPVCSQSLPRFVSDRCCLPRCCPRAPTRADPIPR